MHIALISFEYPPDTAFGGIGTYTRQVARMLSGNGHTVEVFAASGIREGYEEEANLRVNLIKGLDRDVFSRLVPEVFGERNAVRPFDVVESPEFGAEGREILRLYPEVAHVVKLHTPRELVREISNCRRTPRGWLRRQVHLARHLGDLSRWRRRLFQGSLTQRAENDEEIERDYVKQCDFVVSPSKALLDWCDKRWSLDPGRCTVVPNPYVPQTALLDIEPRKGEGVVVGYVGRLEYRKGVANLVEAIPMILQAEPDTQFRFIGEARLHPGTLEPFDTFIQRELGRYASSVLLMGPRPLERMASEYSLLDVCVFPSIWETFGYVCLEAMSAGKPVVATSSGGMAEILANGGGILVTPHSPKELAAAVVRLIRSPELRSTAGKQGRQQVLDRYSATAILPLVEDSYKQAIAINRKRRAAQVSRTPLHQENAL